MKFFIREEFRPLTGGEESAQFDADLTPIAREVVPHAEALNSLAAAIDLTQRRPESPERVQQELLLQLAVGATLFAVKGFAAPEAERAYARARALCQLAGDPPELFPALWELWAVYFIRAEHGTAYETAGQLLQRAPSTRDLAVLLYAHVALGMSLYQMGEFLSAREHLEMGISLYDRERHHPLVSRYGGADAGVLCLSFVSFTLWCLGYPDRALQRINGARALAQELSHPQSLAAAEYIKGPLHRVRWEPLAAQATAEDMVTLSAEHGLTFWLASATILRGWAIAEQGRNEEGITQIREGLAALRAAGAEFARAHYLCLLAEACGEAGLLDDGLRALAESLAVADEHEERTADSEAYRLRGELLLKQNGSNVAEPQLCFERAIEIARKQSAKSWELRATMSLARLLAKRGRREEARAMLAEIYGWFTQGFDSRN